RLSAVRCSPSSIRQRKGRRAHCTFTICCGNTAGTLLWQNRSTPIDSSCRRAWPERSITRRSRHSSADSFVQRAWTNRCPRWSLTRLRRSPSSVSWRHLPPHREHVVVTTTSVAERRGTGHPLLHAAVVFAGFVLLCAWVFAPALTTGRFLSESDLFDSYL